MSKLKKLLLVAAFVVVTLFLPAVVLLLMFDAADHFGTFVLTFVGILFAILGYLVVSMMSLSKELKDAVEEMKKQNAAIAYKLLGYSEGADADTDEKIAEEKEKKDEPKIDTSSVNLNPAEPLPTDIKKSSDDFDDFN